MTIKTSRASLDPASSPTTEKGAGTGLGLSMVSGFTGQSGGRMGIDSVVGRGRS